MKSIRKIVDPRKMFSLKVISVIDDYYGNKDYQISPSGRHVKRKVYFQIYELLKQSRVKYDVQVADIDGNYRKANIVEAILDMKKKTVTIYKKEEITLQVV